MMKEQFDLIVLGGGSAARDGANKAAREHGARVALIERERWGGSCPNVACTPTKAYLVAAELMHDVNTLAPELGIETGPATANLARVKARKDTLKKPQPKWVEDLEAAGFTAITGEASFVDGRTVRVGDRELEADRILIATPLAARDGSPERELRVAQILLASGRVPNVDGLNLEAAGVETTKLGIAVDERLRTSAPGIWAAGDVNAVAQFTPVAQYQARIAVADMFGVDGAAADYTVLPTAIFTDPELAGVGLTEDQAREAGHEVEVVRNRFVRRFSYIDAKHGLYKIVFDRGTRRVLGLHVVSRGASDVVQGFSLAIKLGATVDDLAAMHHVFPTFGEGVKAAAEQARAAVPA